LKSEVHFQNGLNPGEVIETVKTERISVVTVLQVSRKLEGETGAVIEVGHIATSKTVRSPARLACPQGASAIGWKFWALCRAAPHCQPPRRNSGATWVCGSAGYGMTETAALVTVAHPFKQGKVDWKQLPEWK
jgi:long-chain acyl-CoA synthetase